MNNYISIIKSNGTFQFKNSMTSTFEWNLWEGKITDKFVILSAKKHYYDGLNEICLRICIKDGLWTISKLSLKVLPYADVQHITCHLYLGTESLKR